MSKRLESKNKSWVILIIFLVVIMIFAGILINNNIKGQDMGEDNIIQGLINEKDNEERENSKLQNQIDNLKREKQDIENKLEKLFEKESSVVGYNGWLSVKDGKIVNEKHEVFQLRGISSHGINWFPEYTNYGAIKTMRDYGANVFRIAMYTQAEGGYIDCADINFKLMCMAIENAISADIYVVVDWHILDDNDPNMYIDEASDFFDRISKKYSDCPNVLYEICNEPNGDTNWQDIANYADRIIPIIRKNSPNSLIMVGTPNYSNDILSAMNEPLVYENITYSYHVYTNYHKQSEFDELKQAINLKFPVVVSEWGIGHEYYDIDENIQVADRFLDILNANDISWVYWCLSNKDEEFSMLNKDSTKYSGFTDKEFTKTGEYIVEKLYD